MPRHGKRAKSTFQEGDEQEAVVSGDCGSQGPRDLEVSRGPDLGEDRLPSPEGEAEAVSFLRFKDAEDLEKHLAQGEDGVIGPSGVVSRRII